MLKEIIASGKDVSEAKENARALLGAGELDDVQFEIIHAGSKGIFGIIGVKPAQVRAFIELPEKAEKKPRPERSRDRRSGSKGGERPAQQQKPERAHGLRWSLACGHPGLRRGGSLTESCKLVTGSC